MKRVFKYLLLSALTAVFLTACYHQDITEFLEDDTPSLMVRGETQFRFDKSICQESFSMSRKEFRVGDDKMSDYFILTLDQLPLSEGMKIPGSVKWTTDDNVKSLKNLAFSVLKVDADMTVWLKCDAESIYIVVRMIN